MAETLLPDIVETLYAILSVNWTNGNTNSRTPTFYKREATRREEHQNTDSIIIYDKASTITERGIMHQHATYKDYATIECRTSQGPRQAQRMKIEVQRIIHANDSVPTCYTSYTDASTYTAATSPYDTIEVKGTNRPWVSDEDTRLTVEVEGCLIYEVHWT